MDQSTVFNIVFAVIASVGGAGAIVAAYVRFTSKHLSESMLKNISQVRKRYLAIQKSA